jgi:hypothetical protein
MTEISYGPIEKVQEDPVDFRVIQRTIFQRPIVVPVYAFGRKRFETWRDSDGKKWGRWTWEYV